MSFLHAGRPRGGRSPRSCRIHRKQGASWNHGIIGTQRLQCKPSKIAQNERRGQGVFLNWNCCLFFHPKGWPRKDGWARISWCGRSKGECSFYKTFTVVFMSTSHKNTTAVFVIVRTSVLFVGRCRSTFHPLFRVPPEKMGRSGPLVHLAHL